MFQNEYAAIEVAKERQRTDENIVIKPVAQRVHGGYWIAAQVWVSDAQVNKELKEQKYNHAEAERDRIREEGNIDA